MDGFGSRGLCCGDDLVDAQVGLGGGGGPQVDRGVGGLDVGRMGVSVGVDGDGADAEAAAGADDAQGDLAAVGDEDCCEHFRHGGAHILKTP